MKKELSFRHRLVCAMPYSLLRFLLVYKCLKAFLDNCEKDKSETLIKDLEDKCIETGYIINASFVWGITKEGYDFWYRRSNWYRHYLLTNKL